MNVDGKDALMHHYRGRVDNTIPAISNLVDRTAHTWAQALMKNVNAMCVRAFREPDGSCPVPGER